MNILSKASQSYNFYVSTKLAPIHLIISGKMTENLNFFIKQGYDSSKLKMFAKNMLAKTRDEVLSQNEKKNKEKRQ